MDIPSIIWQQISIPTKMACGARNATKDDDSLSFQVTIKRGVRNHVIVRLRGDDTYTVKLTQSRGHVVKVIEQHDGIYADMLSSLIYRMCNK